jgi:hypothetical protein
MRELAACLVSSLLLGALLAVSASAPASAFTEEENARIESIENSLLRLENLLSSLSSSVGTLSLRVENLYARIGNLDNLYASIGALESLLWSLENRITAPSGLQVFLGVVEGGSLSLKKAEENLWVKPGLLLVVVKYENGDYARGKVELYPPLTENALLSLFTGNLPKLEGTLSSGMCLIILPQIEGAWTGKVLDTGLPPYTFSFGVGSPPRPPAPQQTPRIYITTEGVFAKGKPCVVKAVSTSGEMPQGTIRVVDAANPAGSAEGPNPLSYVPKSKSVTAYFLQGDNVVAYATLSEAVVPSGGEGFGWWKVALPLLALALLASYFLIFKKKIPIPR